MAYSKARRLADLMGAGDAAIPAGKLAAKAVAYSKIQDVSATDLILGRDSAGAGAIEEISPTALRTMLGIEPGSTADQSNAEIRTAVEAATDSNVFTDADHSKLNAIEASATADQSNAEIETAYDAQVAVATQGEAEAGSSTSVKRFTPQRIGQAIAALASGGLDLVAVQTSGFTAAAGNQYLCNTTGGAFAIQLPTGAVGDTIGIIDYSGTFDTNNLTLTQQGSEKIFRADADGVIDTKNWSTSIKYMDATVGWLPAGG